MKKSTVEKNGITPEVIETVRSIVKKVPWPERRQSMAQVTINLLDSKPRVAEEVFGWGRATVELGMNELRTGIRCLGDISNRHRTRTEDIYPEMLHDIHAIMEPECQADPHLRTNLAYTNMSASAVRKALLSKGWSKEQVPTERTISDMLNRHGYVLRPVAKTKVQKKTELTDPIFENVHAVNREADCDPNTVRVSIDTKTTIPIGDFSRGGKSRARKAVKALDHDMMPKEKIIPGGLLETETSKPFLFFTENNKTSDFLADGINLWWMYRQEALSHIDRIVMNLDNGPECSGKRTRFLQRMVDFSDETGLEVRLIYYPPYHSKYNTIERYWGGLEKSWNGYLLNSVESVLKRAKNFVWKSAKTSALLLKSVYQKGISLCGKEKAELEKRLIRSEKLQWWDITIKPLMVN